MVFLSFLFFVIYLPWIVNTTVVCQNSNVDIVCPENTTIHIQEANYGRTDRDTCRRFFGIESFDCINNETEKTLVQHCENKTSCSIPVNNYFLPYKCVGISKYLNMTYFCQDKTGRSQNTGSQWISCQNKDESELDGKVDGKAYLAIGIILGCLVTSTIVSLIYFKKKLCGNVWMKNRKSTGDILVDNDMTPAKVRTERQDGGQLGTSPEVFMLRHEYDSIKSSSTTATYNILNDTTDTTIASHSYSHLSNSKTPDNYDIANAHNIRASTTSNQYDS